MVDVRSDAHGALHVARDTRLAFRTWTAPAPQAAVLVVHGLGEHAGRYAEFGANMAASGVSTFALDLRGHGRSPGRRGHLPAVGTVLQDVDAFREHVQASGHHVPLFLLGQSMGGLLAIRYLQQFPDRFRGAIICSPWLATAMDVPRWKSALAPLLARLLPALPFRHNLRAEDLSRDAGIVQAYRADPLVHGIITPRTFAELTRAMDQVREQHDRLRRPILFLVGGADRVVDTPTTLAFAQSIADADVTIREYPEHHHELLNEIDRDAIHGVIADWIRARV